MLCAKHIGSGAGCDRSAKFKLRHYPIWPSARIPLGPPKSRTSRSLGNVRKARRHCRRSCSLRMQRQDRVWRLWSGKNQDRHGDRKDMRRARGTDAVFAMRGEGGAAGDLAAGINLTGLERRIPLYGGEEIFDRRPPTSGLRRCRQIQMAMKLPAYRCGAARQPTHVVRGDSCEFKYIFFA